MQGKSEVTSDQLQQFLGLGQRDAATLEYVEGIWSSALQDSNIGVWCYDAVDGRRFYSPGWCAMRGMTLEEAYQDTYTAWLERIHPEDFGRVLAEVEKHNNGNREKLDLEYRERRSDGKYIWIEAHSHAVRRDANGRPVKLVGYDLDVTKLKDEERQRAEAAFAVYRSHINELKLARATAEQARIAATQIAVTDQVSGLANRRGFQVKLDEMVLAPGMNFCVILLDLDHFKKINDRYGHNVGDEVIKEVATRLKCCAPEASVIARLGGDEFGLIIPEQEGSGQSLTQSIVAKIIEELKVKFQNEPYTLDLRASIGIGQFPKDGTSSSELLRRADLALYSAKQTGRGKACAYNAAIGAKATRDAQLLSDLRTALSEGRIQPYFQPIVDLRSGRTLGLEVLARWMHPDLGRVSAAEFIPLAAQLGLEAELTHAILTRAFSEAAEWPQHLKLSVNVSASEICDPEFAQSFLTRARQHRFATRRLNVEITEHALRRDLSQTKLEVDKLRAAGVRVYLDDFGSGFSGLCYLRSLVLDGIKIDRCFSKNLKRDTQPWKVLSGVLDLARSLSLEACVEGIADHGAFESCVAMGFHHGQGHYFHEAMPASAVATFLAEFDRPVTKSA